MSTLPVQTSNFTLAGQGVVAAATSLSLQSFKTITGVNLAMSDFGTIGYGTIEPNTTNEDSITFTGITQNADGTATLTGVESVGFTSPYTASSGLRLSHAGSVPFIITNTSAFQAGYANKSNDETITGYWKVPDPVGSTDIANKEYVIAVASGGTVSFEKVVVAGTAGENLTAGNLVYLKTSDSKWWKVDADLTATIDNVKLGIAVSSTSANAAITSGVQVSGLYTTTGLTANSLYYASNTAGAISTSAGTLSKVIGQAISTTQLIFDPQYYTTSTSDPTAFVTTSAGAGDAGKGVKTNASGLVDSSFLGGIVAKNGSTTYNVATASGNQTIAHGLGKLPIIVRLTATSTTNLENSGTTGFLCVSETILSGGSNNSIFGAIGALAGTSSNGGYSLNGSTFRLQTSANASNYVTGTVTVDSTNITIAWTKTGSPTGTANLLWETIA